MDPTLQLRNRKESHGQWCPMVPYGTQSREELIEEAMKQYGEKVAKSKKCTCKHKKQKTNNPPLLTADHELGVKKKRGRPIGSANKDKLGNKLSGNIPKCFDSFRAPMEI